MIDAAEVHTGHETVALAGLPDGIVELLPVWHARAGRKENLDDVRPGAETIDLFGRRLRILHGDGQ